MVLFHYGYGGQLMRSIFSSVLFAFCFMVSGCRSSHGVHVFVGQISRDSTDIVAKTFPANDEMSRKYQGDYWVFKLAFDEVSPDPDRSPTFMRVDFMIAIQNKTKENLYLYDEEFEMGYYNLDLDIRRSDGKVITLTKREGTWYRNFPRMRVVPPNTFLFYPVTLQPSVWKNLPDFEIGEEIWVKARFQNGEALCDGHLKPLKPQVLESEWAPVIIKGRRCFDPLIGK